MSAQPNKENDSMVHSRIVTDAAHERLKQANVYCPSCRENFPANKISKHFVRTHVSDNECLYCHGSVYSYITFQVNADGKEVPKNQTFHSCRVCN